MSSSILLGLTEYEAIAKCFRISDKTRAESFLDGFENEPFYEFIGEVILKINLVWNTKTSEKFIKNSVVLSSWIINEFFEVLCHMISLKFIVLLWSKNSCMKVLTQPKLCSWITKVHLITS